MPTSNKIEISQLNFWLVTTVLSSLIVGVGTWAFSMNSQMVEQQISMMQMKTIVESIDSRLKDNLEVVNNIHIIESDLRILRIQSSTSANDLANIKVSRFLMSDYDKYVRPVQEDLLHRMTRLETKVEQK